MVFAGFDSAGYQLQFTVRNTPHFVKGLLGVGVRTEDLKKLSETYKSSMTSVFKKFGSTPERPAYCAAELSALFGASKGIDKEKEALELFVKQILPCISEVHFYYTYLFNVNLVSIYGDDPDGVDKIPPASRAKDVTDFYDLISPAYSMVCAWKYGQGHARDELWVDSFQGRVNPAWNEVAINPNLRVFYNGDRCNALVSSADLICRLIKLRMLEQKSRFLKEEMEEVLPEAGNKLKLNFLGSIYLRKLAPHKRTRLDSRSYAQHPVFFLIRECPRDENERALVEATPAFNDLLERAFDSCGSVKFFHPDGDPRIVGKNDVILTYGPHGEQIVKSLKALGKTFSHEPLQK